MGKKEKRRTARAGRSGRFRRARHNRSEPSTPAEFPGPEAGHIYLGARQLAGDCALRVGNRGEDQRHQAPWNLLFCDPASVINRTADLMVVPVYPELTISYRFPLVSPHVG